MEAVLSLSMKFVYLYYQIRYSREKNNHHSFLDFRKCKNNKWKSFEWTAGEWRKVLLRFFQIMQKIRVSRQNRFYTELNNLVPLLVRKTCMRWIFNTLSQRFPRTMLSLDVMLKSTTQCDGNKHSSLSLLFLLFFFSSRVQKGLLSRV